MAKAHSIVGISGALFLAAALVACGKGGGPAEVGVAPPTIQQALPVGAAVSPVHQEYPLLSAMRKGSVERVSLAHGQSTVRVEFSLEREGKTSNHTYQAEGSKDAEYYFGQRLNMRRCEDSACTKLAPETEVAPYSVELRCQSGDCRSSLAFIRDTNLPTGDGSVIIERQNLTNLEHRSVISWFLKSENLRKDEKAMDLARGGIIRTGNIEVTRVPGTPIKTVSVYTRITPTWTNEVFSRMRLNPNSDLSQLPEYFIKTIGAYVGRDYRGNMIQNLFSYEERPATTEVWGGFRSGNVDLVWSPAYGQILIAMKEATPFARPQEASGTLALGFAGEQLLGPALDDSASPIVDPGWVF